MKLLSCFALVTSPNVNYGVKQFQLVNSMLFDQVRRVVFFGYGRNIFGQTWLSPPPPRRKVDPHAYVNTVGGLSVQ